MANPEITNNDPRPKVLGVNPRAVGKTIAQDASGIIPEGAVLGEITIGSVTSAAKAGGNTGNGTLTALSAVEGARPGVYTARVIEVAANVARFEVKGPDGNQLGLGIVTGAGGTFVFENEIRFTITDGGTDFIVGDGFDITVAAGNGKLKRCEATSTDGSKIPKFVTAKAIDAVAGDVSADVVFDGSFRASYLKFKGSETLATVVWGKTYRQRLEEAGLKVLDDTTLSALDNQ